MTSVGNEQLVIKSPEYERAVDDLYSTANALVLLHQRSLHEGESIFARLNSAKLPQGHIFLSKKLPFTGQSLAEWYKQPPHIQRIKFSASDMSGALHADIITEKEGVLFIKDSYSEYGEYNEKMHEMTSGEIVELQSELEQSTPQTS